MQLAAPRPRPTPPLSPLCERPQLQRVGVHRREVLRRRPQARDGGEQRRDAEARRAGVDDGVLEAAAELRDCAVGGTVCSCVCGRASCKVSEARGQHRSLLPLCSLPPHPPPTQPPSSSSSSIISSSTQGKARGWSLTDRRRALDLRRGALAQEARRRGDERGARLGAAVAAVRVAAAPAVFGAGR